MKLYLIILVSLCSPSVLASPSDSIAYNLYKKKVVLYSDLGYNSSPFSIKDDYLGGIGRLKYKHNQKVVLGFGIAYKWFALRIGLGLPGTIRPIGKFGNPNYQDLGLKFTVKKTFWDIDFRNYKGYSILDANRWDDSLNNIYPNAIEKDIRSVSLSVNSWYFKSDNFKMQAVEGKVGDFRHSQGTWYFKSTLNLFGVGNEGKQLTPIDLIDTNETKSYVNAISALDIGLVPGYAYVYRNGFWQASAFAGLGAVLQAKFFAAKGITRGFLGLAPRVDLRFIAGYSKPKYFIWLTAEFDFKSITFQEMKFKQGYHRIRLVGGLRLNKKQKEKKRRKN